MNITFPSVCIINGAQRQGKSHLIRYIMGHNKDKFKYGIIFSNTGFSSEDNYNYVPQKFIHPHYSEEKLQRLMTIQSKIPKEKRPLCFVIFDDCLFDKQWKSDPLKQLITQVAHYNCFVILSTQYPQSIPSLWRTCAFYSFIFGGLNTKNAMKSMYESYGMNEYENLNEFVKYCSNNTGNYKFIFINNKSGKKFKILTCPEKIPKFTLKY